MEIICINCENCILAPNPPEHVRALIVNPTTVEVTWDPPSITNGILRYYTIVYGSSDDIEMMEVNSSDVTVLVSGLYPFTNYTFYVLAVTVAPSEPSDNVTVLTVERGKTTFLHHTFAFSTLAYLWA